MYLQLHDPRSLVLIHYLGQSLHSCPAVIFNFTFFVLIVIGSGVNRYLQIIDRLLSYAISSYIQLQYLSYIQV